MSGDTDRREVRVVRPGIDRPERDALRLAFGQNLRSLRTAARISRDALARCFVRNDNISRLEHGGPPPRLELVVLLAKTLGVTVGGLTEGLVAPSRAASTERMLALVAEPPKVPPGRSRSPESYPNHTCCRTCATSRQQDKSATTAGTGSRM